MSTLTVSPRAAHTRLALASSSPAALVTVFGTAMHGSAASGGIVHGMAAAFAGGAVLAALALTGAAVAIRSAGTAGQG
ncbi:hypothetical protein [Planotetraspora sp. GP83]|uniref:hypothetical protein n=1 Tax=Planotetraspora sp. GP83 TaxID=3156264 RepID=UPI003514FA33